MFFLDRFIGQSQKSIEASKKRLSELTHDELKLFMLLREGFTKKGCSQRLKIPQNIVNKNIKNIYQKLNVKTTSELIIKYKQIN